MIDNVRVSREGPDFNDGYSWLVTFMSNVGDLSNLIVHDDFLTGTGANMDVREYVQGQELSGTFTIWDSLQERFADIAFDATEEEMATQIERVQDVTTATVKRLGPDTTGGYIWEIEYTDSYKTIAGTSNVGSLIVDDSNLNGEVAFTTLHEGVDRNIIDVDIHIQHAREVQRIFLTGNSLENEVQEIELANAIGGTFRVGMGSFISRDIDYDASEEQMVDALNQLPSIGAVHVTRRIVEGDNGRYVWRIHFVGRLGDIAPIFVDADSLEGIGASAIVREVYVGVVPEVQRISTHATGEPLKGRFSCRLKGIDTGNMDYNASEEAMREAFSQISGVGSVSVDRLGPSEYNEYEWHITFLEYPGDIGDISCNSALLLSDSGTAEVRVHELVRGLAKPLTNQFTIAYKGESTRPLDVTASDEDVRIALIDDISYFSDIDVTAADVGVGGDREWLITFNAPSSLDMRLSCDITNTRGTSKKAEVYVVANGTFGNLDEISGYFTLEYGSLISQPLPVNATDQELQAVIEDAYPELGAVMVKRTSYENMNETPEKAGYLWSITLVEKIGSVGAFSLFTNGVETPHELISSIRFSHTSNGACCPVGSFSLKAGPFDSNLRGKAYIERGSRILTTTKDWSEDVVPGQAVMIGSKIYYVDPMSRIVAGTVTLSEPFSENTIAISNQIKVLTQSATAQIPVNANPATMADALKTLTGAEVKVSREEADVNGGYDWRVTFPQGFGDIVQMLPDAAQISSGTCRVNTLSEGALPEIQRIHLDAVNLLQGSFAVSFNGETSEYIPYDVSEAGLKAAIENLATAGNVTVTRVGSSSTHGFTWDVTFVSNAGNLPKMVLSPINMTVVESTASPPELYVSELQNGTSIPLSGFFSISYMGQPICTLNVNATEGEVMYCLGNYFDVQSIERSVVDFNGGSTWTVHFGGSSKDLDSLDIDLAHVSGTAKRGVIREVRKGGALGGALTVTFSGESVSIPINASATGVKQALESLTSIPSLSEVLILNMTAGEVKWVVDFGPTANGAVEEFTVSDDLILGTSTSARVSYSSTMSRAIEGSFTLKFMGAETESLDVHSSSELIQQALEDLPTVGSVYVEKVKSLSEGFAAEWRVEFTSRSNPPNLGNLELMSVHPTLIGSGATMMVEKIQSGCCSLDLTIDGQQGFGLGRWFRYDSRSHVEALEPTIGHTTGGTEISIFGNSFMNSDFLFCSFNDVYVAASFISSTRLECTLPSLEVGLYFVRIVRDVALEGRRMISTTSAVLDVHPPVLIRGVEPSFARFDKETALSVLGSGFQDVNSLSCKFERTTDGIQVVVGASFISRNRISCVVPKLHPSFAAILKVYVTVNGQDYTDEYDIISLIDRPHVSQLDSFWVPSHGGSLLTVHGSGFRTSENLKCAFREHGDDSVDLISPAFASEFMVQCRVPESRWRCRGLRVCAQNLLEGQNVTVNLGNSEPFVLPLAINGSVDSEAVSVSTRLDSDDCWEFLFSSKGTLDEEISIFFNGNKNSISGGCLWI